MAKKAKKEIKDSIDVEEHQAQEEIAKEEQKATLASTEKRPFKERYADFVTSHKVPIVSYCHKLFRNDLNNYKSNPSGLSNDTMFIKNASNKKRFFLRLSYLIGMILLGILFIVLGVLFVTQVIDISGAGNGVSYISGGFMAIGSIILGIFI